MPHELAAIALKNQKLVYEILFSASARALQEVAAEPKRLGVRVGLVSVLHTWGQTLIHHPHVHCLVPGGGISLDGKRWVDCKPGFFLPVRVLSARYRTLFLDAIERVSFASLTLTGSLAARVSTPAKLTALLGKLRRKKWVVFIQAPFSEPKAVLEYQAKYANRTALTNDRLVELEHDHITMSYKDYSEKSIRKTMKLEVAEFVRRFLQHVLPRGFARIRYYGTLANRNKLAFLTMGHSLLASKPPGLDFPTNWQQRFFQLTGREPNVCGHCKLGRLEVGKPIVSLREIRWQRARLPPLPSITRGPPP